MMSNFSRKCFVAVALAFIFGSFSAGEGRAQAVTEVLRRLDNNYQLLKTVQSNIKMEKYDSLLKENDTYEGEIWCIPSKSSQSLALRLDWSKPLIENLIVINGQYRLLRPRLKVEYQGTVDQAKNSSSVASPLAFMNMSKKQLKDNFELTLIGREVVSGGTAASHLDLKPKTAQKYKSAEIWVDDNGMPVQMKIIEKNDDTTTVLLTGVKRNVTINANAIFKLDAPKDTKIVR